MWLVLLYFKVRIKKVSEDMNDVYEDIEHDMAMTIISSSANEPQTMKQPSNICREKKSNLHEQPMKQTRIDKHKPRNISRTSFLNSLPKRPSLKWLYEKDYKDIHFPFQKRKSIAEEGGSDGHPPPPKPTGCTAVESENAGLHIYENATLLSR